MTNETKNIAKILSNLADVIDTESCILDWSNKDAVKEFNDAKMLLFNTASQMITDDNDDNDDIRANERWILGMELLIENNIIKLKTHLELLTKFEKSIKKLKKKYILKSIDDFMKKKEIK